MNLLNACLALALTLGVFASVVTVLVEMLHQTIQQRAKDLHGMLGFVFEHGVPAEALRKLGLDVAALKKEFADTLRSDKVLGDLVEEHGFLLKFVAKRIANASSMSIEDFLRRLPRSGVYQQFLKDLEPEARKEAVKNLVDQFGCAEKAISEFFRVRAKLLSFLVGVCLALFVNVDAVRLFDYFSANPAQTGQAIAQLQAVLAEAQPEAKSNAADTSSAPAAAAAPRDGPAAADPSPPAQDRSGEIAAMLGRLGNSQAFGLPVGWAYYPYCVAPDGAAQADSRCGKAPARQAGENRQGVRAFLSDVHDRGRPLLWFVSAIVTGFLIGLGGPYWFDLAMSLSRLRDFLKGGQSRSGEQAAAPPDPDELVAEFLRKMDRDAVTSTESHPP